MTQDRNHTFVKTLRRVLVATTMLMTSHHALAQVTVKGSVFGGGNEADVQTNTVVNISVGNVEGNVYGGGKIGNVGKYSQIPNDNDGNYNWTDQDGNPNTTANSNNKNTGVCKVEITGGTIGPAGDAASDDDHGNVFGGGKGDNTTFWCEKAMVYSTNVTINNGMVKGDVFGGGEIGRVETDAVVKIGDGEGVASGDPTSAPEIKGSVFGAGKGLITHGYSALVRGNVTLTIEGNAKVHKSVYGGGELASVGRHKVKTSNDPLTPADAPVDLPVGMPYTLDGTNVGECTVNVQGYADIEENVFGAGQGVGSNAYVYDDTFERMGMNGMESLSEDEYLTFLQTLALTTDTDVDISGYAKVKGSVYGGSENGFVQFDTDVSILGNCEIGISGTTSEGNVYGGGRGISGNTIAGPVSGNSTVTINGGTTYGSVYGGGAYGVVKESVVVNVTGGEVKNDVYGGGALANTNTENWDATNETWVTGMYTAATATTPAYTTYKTVVNVLGGIIGTTDTNGNPVNGRVFGGGLGDKTNNIEAFVYGDVKVNLNGLEAGDYVEAAHSNYVQAVAGSGTNTIDHYELKTTTTGEAPNTTTTYATGAVVNSIFAANNQNGTPKGNTTVHVYATQNRDGEHNKINQKYPIPPASNATVSVYDVTAVYGGGNLANYVPVYNQETGDTEFKTQVIIEGCSLTSIETVYGGGNAAAVPETNVTVKSAYEIGYVFGGGDGHGAGNPGADVGTPDHGTTTYGTGNANTLLEGGVIHEVYGGSNQKGIIKGSLNQTTNPKNPTDPDCCELIMDKVVGAGKYADIDGDVNMTLSCQPSAKVPLLFAGADEANVNGNITLNITNGYFGQVFGGNNLSGAVKGKITVNVEETGCQPIRIDELYLGGNEAAYSRFGYYIETNKTKDNGTGIGDMANNETAELDNDGRLVFIPRTSATDTHKAVKTYNRNDNSWTVYAGDEDDPAPTYANPELNIISCTYIGNVFGGGWGTGAKLYADPTVNINMIPGEYASQIDRDGNGSPDNDADALGEIVNVYGGGNAAEVIGNTTVNIATEPTVTLTTGTDHDPKTVLGAYITGNVFGAGKGKDDNVQTALVRGNANVNMGGGTVKGNIYGGGELSSVGDFTYTSGNVTACAENTGKTTVTISGGTIGDESEYVYNANSTIEHTNGGNVFAGGKGSLYQTGSTTAVIANWPEFAKVKNTELNISGGTIMSNVYGGAEIGSVGYENGSTIVGATDINITGGTIGTEVKDGTTTKYTFGSVFGGGYGSTVEELTDANNNKTNPKLLAGIVYGKTDIDISGDNTRVWASVYGGGEVASVKGKAGATEFATNILISGGKIGKDKLDANKNANGTQFGGATMGNVYGGGKGYKDIVRAGQIKGNTKVTISGGTIYHNVYGGGAYATVGDFNFTYSTELPGFSGKSKVNGIDATNPLDRANTGKAEIYITGGTIGVDGIENGMVFGSSRGDVGIQRDLWLAWVYDTKVEIGTSGQGTTYTAPIINGSVYGSGENGHVYTDTDVKIYSGTIGIYNPEHVVKDGDGKVTKDYNNTRGNVYGGGCGEDTYPTTNAQVAGMEGLYEPSAGIVYGTTKVTMTGGTVKHNIYGAGALGSVGRTTTATNGDITITSGGTTTIEISGGIVGDDGTHGDGNVFGAARGDSISTQAGISIVKKTNVTISGSAAIKGNVYGGGQAGDVGTYHTVTEAGLNKGNNNYLPENDANSGVCTVLVTGGTIGTEGTTTAGHVFGAGKGAANTYTCQKAMVKETSVTISNGTIYGDVYGGGEVGRVEQDATVSIGTGTGSGTFAPIIHGNVFGAGAGLETHGYSALVRGNSNVTIGGSAAVRKNVYGGGKAATVGKYWVSHFSPDPNEAPPAGFPDGMPYKTRDGGLCTVTIQGNATIGPANGDASETEGQVFGAGKGVSPSYSAGKSKRMNDQGQWEYFDGTTGLANYFQFLETLALASNTRVTIGGGTIKASVFGGSESGFVQDHTTVTVNGGTIGTSTTETYGNVFGGGKGLETFAEAGRVRGNTTVAFNGGTAYGSVYGGGKLGDVGTIDKTDIDNYTWSGYDDTDPNNDTGICNVSVSGGEVKHHVFGAGKGSGVTFQCEKAMAYNTKVTISDGTVNGNVYGGGEIGRVENDTQVTVGRKTTETEGNGTGKPDIKGSVFGAGKGLDTHGYSALVRGNTAVTVEGASGAKVGVNVYGGGEIASVGRYGLNAQKMPNILLDGGRCIVKVLGNVAIGPAEASDDKGNVFGAGKGVVPDYKYSTTNRENNSKRMVTYDPNRAKKPHTNDSKGTLWDPYDDQDNPQFVWEYFTGDEGAGISGEDEYNSYLETLALATHPEVTIAGGATINSSVFGGGELGLTKGSVIVNINGGTIVKDVYGGGSLANTNTTDKVGVKDNVNGGWEKDSEGEYVTTDVAPTTTVNLKGGSMRHAYGGGLGRVGANPIEAKVCGDVTVKLNEGKSTDDTGAKVDRVFGANNLNGSPQKNVTVYVYATQKKGKSNIGDKNTKHAKFDLEADGATTTTYDVLAVYGGGNEAAYIPETAYTEATPTGSKTQVFIEGCDATSIKTVYGGGNAASVPESNVTILSAYEIERVFGGGNGKDATSYGENPGADIGIFNKVAYDADKTTGIYGTGNANTDAQGGYIHELYGASNEKGTIRGNIDLKTQQQGTCTLKFDRIYNAGKNADVEGDMIAVLSCQPSEKIPEYYGGAENANVKGNVELTITNGHYGKIFAGNNKGGAIFGHIKLNIEETGCRPIEIDELYGCGNNAAYSVYGYYQAKANDSGVIKDDENNLFSDASKTVPLYKDGSDNVYWDEAHNRPFYLPRTSADDTHDAVSFANLPHTAIDATAKQYEDPVINIISATRIGKVFGGGLGAGAVVYGNPTVNINQIYGTPNGTAATTLGEIGGGYTDENDQYIEGGVFGGGNAADVVGNSKVNIGTIEKIRLHESWTAADGYTLSDEKTVLGANIVGNVYGGGNEANITGDTYVTICAKEVTSGTTTTWEKVTYGTGVSIDKKVVGGTIYGGSVYGGGCSADVFGNTNVRMSDGYVFNGIFGGGYAGNVGTFTRSFADADLNVFGHTTHTGCIGKPTACAEGTGKCTVVVDGGQIGPIEVAIKDKGMNRPVSEGGPVPQGWVWGAGQGLIEDPAVEKDTHFKSYVGSTDVTIGGTALIMESIIGGGEFGRVLGGTKVTITGQCQIGVGANQTETVGGVLKPKRYTDDQFVNPLTTTITNDNALAACSHFPYGNSSNTYLPYDPYYDKYYAINSSIATSDLAPASTASPSDGKTWIGCVFAGGSGYMPYEKEDGSGYDWCSSAGLVEGNTELIISGGHILTNVYGGNEVTNVKGKCKVTMTGGTIGVPRTVEQILAHPVICNLFGAGKGDQRPHFNTETNVGEVEIDISGGIIYGSVFGGGEDGHVLRDVTMTIGGDEDNAPIIGTWGTSYMDGNVFGGGRGFGGDAYTAGNVAGSVDLKIKGGTILGSVYGGGRLGSVGYGLYPPSAGDTYYGAMRPDNTGDDANNTAIANFKRGYVDVEISGGTIGNKWEYEFNPNDTYKTTYVPNTEYDSDNRLKHTKGGNVFAGGMGRLYQLDGITPISAVDWWKVGCVKQTKLTITGGTIKSCVYGGGELGAVKPYVNGTTVQGGTTEIIIKNENNTQIGTEVKDGSNATQYTFGSVYGGGYGSTIEYLGQTDDLNTENDNPKFVAGLVYGDTKIDMQGGKVLASVYGGGEVASVNGSADVAVSGGEVGKDKVGTKQFGGPTMGNVYGGGSGHPNIVRCGRILHNTKVTISETDATNHPTKIYHNVYGGGAYGTVGDFNYSTGTDGKVNGVNSRKTDNTGKAEIIITGGTIGTDGHNNGMVFGSSRGDINKKGERDDHTAWVYGTSVTIGTQGSETGPAIKGSIYGSGENGHTFNDAHVAIHSGKIGIDDVNDPDGGAAYAYRGNVYGGGCGTDKYYSYTPIPTGHKANDGEGDKYNPLAGIVYGNTIVTIDGGTVVRNVYGAGAMGSVGKKDATTGAVTGGKTTINVSGGTIGVSGTAGDGNVYGAARGDLSATEDDLAQVYTTEVNIKPNTIGGKPEATIKGSVFGGGEAGIVKGTVAVSVSGGNVLQDVYGGGALADTNTDNWGTDTWASGKSAASNTTTVNLTGGKVTGNVYGGGLGKMAVGTEPAIEAKVYGNTTVELNKGVDDAAKGCIVKGSIFGCNNMSGSPQGTTTVHIYKTQRDGASRITNTDSDKTAKVKGTKTGAEYNPASFDVKAVYGGGNMAAYEPVDLTTVSTNVIIDGCDRTSICQVYGGGNAASTPATSVTVNGTYEIGELFGGGNGKDDIVKNDVTLPNPGANVGYKDYSEYYQEGTTWKVKDAENADTKKKRLASSYVYGTGVASVNVFGGLVHRVFGGSNTKGNVRQTAVTLLDEAGGCEFCVDEAYGGGKNAPMDAEAKLLMACIPGLEAVYGGAEAADVRGNVTLNITNGTFDRVFGGNNLSGTIGGSITVNVEEVGCKPIIIGELYGGGNQAAYSIYGYDADGKAKETGTKLYDDPQVNVMSFTSIGNIYGGGYGDGATMVGNPTVNVSVVEGAWKDYVGESSHYEDEGYVYDATGYKGETLTIVDSDGTTTHDVDVPSHAKGKMGAINNVFGGGNAAKVIGNTTVNIGTQKEVYVVKTVTVGDSVTDYYTRNTDGTYTAATGTAVDGTTYYEKKAVLGADIRGNVYGGGNNAEVTGNTNVTIGKISE